MVVDPGETPHKSTMRSSLLEIAPWLVAWSGEAEGACQPCPHAGGRLATWAVTAQGDGKPLYRRLHPVRLRQCIAERLCGVCGEPTSAQDRWMINRGDWTREPGELRFLLRDFLLHADCAEHATAHCPWLRTEPHRRVRAPAAFNVIATSRLLHLKGCDGAPDYRGPVIERLWLTLSPADAIASFGRLIPKPPGLTRIERRSLRHRAAN